MRLAGLGIALFVLASLALRPPAPLDETRYLAVAWEMHQADAWLVPRLDGVPYHHKPPFLFWAIRAGWSVFGVHGWWPRLLPGLAALLGVYATAGLARRLGARDQLAAASATASLPRPADAGRTAALLLAGGLAWPLYASLLLFDLWLSLWVLVGWHALLDRDRHPWRAAFGLTAAVGLGILTKGPVVLLLLLPAALLLPVQRPGRAAGLTLAGMAGGILLALAWALPAAAAGGEAYREALLFGQTAGRLRDSFSHARPFWWYLPIAALLLFPWWLVPGWWRSLRQAGTTGRRALLAVGLTTLVFLLISGKQPHYLLPLVPVVLAVAASRWTPGPGLRRAPLLTATVLSLGLAGVLVTHGQAFDLRPSAAALRAEQQDGRPLAVLGDSHGQWSFLARLDAPPARLGFWNAQKWASQHPHGAVLMIEGAARRSGDWRPEVLAQASLRQPYRNEEIALVPAWALLPPGPDFAPAIAQAQRLLREALADGVGPGISAAVGYRGRLVWAEGFGWAELSSKRPVTPATRFRIGSVSKSLTAVGLMKLVEAGQLDLDAEVHRYVPEFPRKRWPLSTRQLAGHLAGIRHYRGAEFLSSKPYPTVAEGLEIFAEDPLLHEPGTAYRYSSYGWNLLSAAMEGASGQPFLEFMQAEVFTPLGLHETRPDHVSAPDPERTAYYQKLLGANVPAVPVDNSYKWAGGGFLSTPRDLIHFGFGVLGDQLLSPETRDAMWRSQRLQDGSRTGYGIGWSTRRDAVRGRVRGHSGGSVGGVTQFQIYLDHQLVVALTINNSEGPAGRLARQMADVFLARLAED